MNRRELFIVAVAAGLISGCATPNTQTAQTTDPDDKTYITGSRLPVKDNGAQKAAAERAANNPDKGIKDQLMRGGGATGGVTGAGGS